MSESSLALSGSTSTPSTSSSSSSNDIKFFRLNKKLMSNIKKSWSFRKTMNNANRHRSHSDFGVYHVTPEQNLKASPLSQSSSSTNNLAKSALHLLCASSNILVPKQISQPTVSVTSADLNLSENENGDISHDNNLGGSGGNFNSNGGIVSGSGGSGPGTGLGGGGVAGPGGARSAPCTPLQPATPSTNTKNSKEKSGKQTWSGGESVAPSPVPAPTPVSSSHKARQKKFHRHFPQAAMEERVLNYYSCALVGDILLQGHLYITDSYFAFYSNVFGYVTKLLIPLSSVVRVSKEKMARIIPNAVGVHTVEDKHVFGSLLSRDSTYKLMTEVWKSFPAEVPETEPLPDDINLKKTEIDASELSQDDESSWGSQGSGGDDGGRLSQSLVTPKGIKLSKNSEDTNGIPRLRSNKIPDVEISNSSHNSLPITRKNNAVAMSGTNTHPMLQRKRSSNVPTNKSESSNHVRILIVSTILLIFLFTSAGYLLYRIGMMHSNIDENNILMLKKGDDIYTQIIRWHSHLHSKSASQINEFLHSNLDQIAKVRQSLEALSILIGGIISDRVNSPIDTGQSSFISAENSEIPSQLGDSN